MSQIDFGCRLTWHSLTYDDQPALRKLKNRTDVVIKQADKGEAFVVWKDLYIAEGKRQLTEEQFYDKIPGAATQSSQQEAKTFINTAIESNQLSPSATNLIVEQKYLQFYSLPKIHKPGNPGSFSFFEYLRYPIPNFDPNTRKSISFDIESRFFSIKMFRGRGTCFVSIHLWVTFLLLSLSKTLTWGS